MSLISNECLFGNMKEPMRSVGYRIWVLGESYEEIMEKTDLPREAVEAIAKESMKKMVQMVDDADKLDKLNQVAEPQSEYKVD